MLLDVNIARRLLQLDMNWPRAMRGVSKQVNIAEDCDVQGELGGAQKGCGGKHEGRVREGKGGAGYLGQGEEGAVFQEGLHSWCN